MNNISKIVIEKENGRQIGYILDILLDGLKKIGYVIVDDETEGEFALYLKDISCIGENIVIVDNVSKLELLPERNSVIGKLVVGDNGEDFGSLKSLEYSKNICIKLITQKCEISAKFVNFIGKDVIFVSTKRRQKHFSKHTFPKADTEILVETQSYYPEKISLSQNFYLGKVVLKNVFGYNNERIASAGEVVSKSIFEKAKKHNKLNELFFSLKREKIN